MSAGEPKYIIVGTFASPYGVKGWIKINSATEPQTAITQYLPWQLKTPQGWQPLNVTETKLHGKIVIAKLANYSNRETVAMLTGKQIGILRSQLAELPTDEYYWSDLEGLTVINQQGVELGTVDHLMETGSNDVLIVVKDKSRCLIPFIKQQVIINVDLTNKQILVNWDPEF